MFPQPPRSTPGDLGVISFEILPLFYSCRLCDNASEMGSPWFEFSSELLIFAFVFRRTFAQKQPWSKVVLMSLLAALAMVGLHTLGGQFRPLDGITHWVREGHF
jgi:hypothetical protein